VLFGKLNLRTKSTDVSLFTDQTTYNLEFEGDVIINSSLPIIVEAEDNTITNIELDNSISPINLIMNGKNPGFAIDAGITYPYNDKLEFSASVLDLGFIRWRSNLNTFDASGNFSYEGVLSDDIPTDNYFRSLQRSLP